MTRDLNVFNNLDMRSTTYVCLEELKIQQIILIHHSYETDVKKRKKLRVFLSRIL